NRVVGFVVSGFEFAVGAVSGISRFVNSTWPTLILSFGPPGTKRSPVLLSALGGPGRSGALRRAFCGTFRAERRPGLPRACDQNVGSGTGPPDRPFAPVIVVMLLLPCSSPAFCGNDSSRFRFR